MHFENAPLTNKGTNKPALDLMLHQEIEGEAVLEAIHGDVSG